MRNKSTREHKLKREHTYESNSKKKREPGGHGKKKGLRLGRGGSKWRCYWKECKEAIPTPPSGLGGGRCRHAPFHFNKHR